MWLAVIVCAFVTIIVARAISDGFAHFMDTPVCNTGQLLVAGLFVSLALYWGYRIGHMDGTNTAAMNREPWHRVAKVSYEWERHP